MLNVCLTNLRRTDHIGFAVIPIADVSLLGKGMGLFSVRYMSFMILSVSSLPTYSLQLHMLVSTGIHLTIPNSRYDQSQRGIRWSNL